MEEAGKGGIEREGRREEMSMRERDVRKVDNGGKEEEGLRREGGREEEEVRVKQSYVHNRELPTQDR